MGVTLYFVFDFAVGKNGLSAWRQQKVQLAELRGELTMVKTKRESIEKQAHALRSESLDLDLLEEKSRNLLKLSHERDYFLPYDKVFVREEGF